MLGWPGVESVFFDWGGTLASLGREADRWHQCASAAAKVVDHDLSWCLYSAADLLHERFTAALNKAKNDPECREVDTRAVLAAWGEDLGLGDPEEWPIDRAYDAFWQTWVGALDPIDGVPAVLSELKKRGYRLGLVSNTATPPEYVELELERQGLTGLLDAVVVSSALNRRKPHPEIYETALTAVYDHGTAPDVKQVLFVGDGPIHDVVGPQKLGMKTALVRYNGTSTWTAEEFAAAKPDTQVAHVRELLNLLPATGK